MKREDMIINNLGLAQRVARKYANKEYARYTYGEYLSICYEALIKAVDSFKDNVGTKFSTYVTRSCVNNIAQFHRDDKWYKIDRESLNNKVNNGEDGDIEYIDLLEGGLSDYTESETIKFIKEVFVQAYTMKGKSYIDRNTEIVKLRVINGYDYITIGNKVGVSKQQVDRVMKKFREESRKIIN